MGRDSRFGGRRDDRRSSGRNFNNRGFSGGRDSGFREKFDAICDECGNSCQVPFRPSGDKPVYCDACFGKNKGRDSGHGDRHSGGSRGDGSGQNKEQFNSINAKLDQILSILKSAPQADLEKIEEVELSEVEEVKPKAKKEKKSAKKEAKKTTKKK